MAPGGYDWDAYMRKLHKSPSLSLSKYIKSAKEFWGGDDSDDEYTDQKSSSVNLDGLSELSNEFYENSSNNDEIIPDQSDYELDDRLKNLDKKPSQDIKIAIKKLSLPVKSEEFGKATRFNETDMNKRDS